MLLDLMLYAFFAGRGWKPQRQLWAPYLGVNGRIDFKIGTNNPAFIELAVRPPNGGSQLYSPANFTELSKLCRIPHSKARLRVLLLIDLYFRPVESENLKSSYESMNAGRGNFQRSSVRVIYVHHDEEHDFLWNPRA